jgi:hypothetical protein
MTDLKQALKDFVATANSGKYADERVLMSKFPELKGYDIGVLKDFVATSNSGKYKTEDELFSKFPEFAVKKKEQASPSQQKAQPTSLATGGEMAGGPSAPSARKRYDVKGRAPQPQPVKPTAQLTQKDYELMMPFMGTPDDIATVVGDAPVEQPNPFAADVKRAAGALVASSKPGFNPVSKEEADKALYGKANVQTGTLKGMPGETRSTVQTLNEKYKDLGVSFKEAPSKIRKGFGLGDIVVTADDGSTHVVQSTGSDEKLREEEAKLQTFLMGKSAGVEKKPVSPMEFLMMSRDGVSPQEEAKFKRVYSQELVDSSIKFANNELEKTKTGVDKIQVEIAKLNEDAMIGGVTPEIEARFSELQGEYERSIKYAKSIASLTDEGVKKAAGENARIMAESGNVAGGLYNALLNGSKMLVEGAADIVAEGIDMATLGAIGDVNTSGTTLYTYDKKKAREDRSVFLNEIYNELKDATTKEYTTTGNMAWKALFSVPEFIPSLVVPGGASARIASMWSQGVGRRYEEMDSNPETKNLPEEEKFFMAAGPAYVEARLENFGLTQWLGSNKGLASSIFLRAVAKVTPNAGVKGLNRIINSEINNLVLRGAVNTAGAMISEAETGALQNISETAFRDAYEIAKDKNLFKQPGFGEDGFKKALLEDAVMEGLGGMWMAGAVNIAQQTADYATGKANTNETFRLVKEILSDKTTASSLFTTLKSQMMDGKISKEQAQNVLNNFNEARAIVRELPQELSEDNQRAAFDLIAEKRKLTKQIEGKDPALVDKQKKRITEIDKQLITISNAVQEQATSEVPVQPEARTGQEVVEGKPKPEPQVAAEEGKAQEEIIPISEISERQDRAQSQIKRQDLFDGVGSFSRELGGSKVDAVPVSHSEINGIEFVQYANPQTGSIDVVVTGTSGNDFVGFYRIYENGNPTNKWSSKFENQSRNKENFKTMISGVQSLLPKDHQYTEKTSISTDGLRVWNQQLDRGYELQYDEDGNLVTNEVAINGDAIVNELGIDVLPGEFENISVTTNEQFGKVKNALLPYLAKMGLNENNVKWENGTVKIDLPVLAKTKTAKNVASDNVSIDRPSIVSNSKTEVDKVVTAAPEVETGQTFNLDGTVYADGGLVVPVVSQNMTQEELTPERIADFVEENRDKIGNNSVKVGIYKFPNSNEVSIDLNIVVPKENREAALEFGRLSGQESLFDLDTFENIKTGSDGKNTSKFTATQFVDIAKALEGGNVPSVFGDTNFDEVVNKSAQSLNMVAPGLKIIIAENTDDAQMQIAEALSAVAPSQAGEVAAGFTTETRGQTVFVNGKPYAMVFNKETADSVTAGHEVWEVLLNDAFADDQARMKEFVNSIDAQLRAQGFEDIADRLEAFASQRGYEAVKYSEYMAELGGMLVASGFGKGPLTAQQKTLLQKIGDIINKFAELFTGKKQFLDQATPEDILGFMITISEKVSKGEDISQFFRQEPGTIIDQNDVSINTRDSKKQKFENNEYEVPQKVYNPKGGTATGFTFIADRMRTGEWTGLNPNSGINIKLMGGIGYPMLKKLFKKAGWAVDGGSVMSSFLNKIVKSQTGIGFPVIMSEYSHVSNLTFAKIFEAEMDWMVKNKEISKKEQLDNVNDFIASSLIGKKDLSPKLKENPKTGLMEDKNANAPLRVFTTEKNGVYTPKTYKSIEDVYKELETTFGARALFMQNMIGVGVKNRYAKIDKYKFPDMVRVADETADPRLKGVPSGSAVSAIQFDQKKAKQFVDDIGSNKDLKKFHSASAVGVDPHISYEYVVEGSSLGWLPGVVDLAEAEGVEPDTKEWYDEQRAKYKEGSISEAQLRSNVTAKARASMPEVKIKTKSQKSVPPVVDEVLTDDGKGNYVFVHYSDEKRDTIKPMSGSKKNFTGREEVAAISSVGGVAMYYTKQGQKEQGVGNVPHTVIVPKDKVYFYGTTEKGKVSNDPENFEPEARRRFQEYKNRGNETRPTTYAFDSNNAAAWVTKVAAENGYDMLVTNWGAPKSYRAQTVKELTPEAEYTGFKEIPDAVFEVGDEVFLQGRYGNITEVDGDVLTIKSENRLGSFDTSKFQVTNFTRDRILLIEKAKPTVTTRAQKVDVTVIPGYERFLGVIEGMIDKAIKRGTSYNKTTENVIEYIQRDSAVYKRADDSQREQIIRDFVKIRGEKFKTAPSVARIMGQIKDTKEVTVKEKTALKDQIKLEAKAAKDAVAYVKQLRTQISTALRAMTGRGVISARQATTILARYDKMNILNPVMRDRFVDYMSNVLRTAEYKDKVAQASKLRRDIKKAAKSEANQAEVAKTAKAFNEISPSMVEDIDQYIEIAESLLKSVARKVGSPMVRDVANLENMIDYIDKTVQEQRAQIKNDILSQNQDLVDAGVLSSKMTINEINKVVQAIEEKKDQSEEKLEEAKKAVKGMMDEMSPIIKKIVRTGEDPFTGDPIDLTIDEKRDLMKLANMDTDDLSLANAIKAVEYANNFIANGVTSGISGLVNNYEGSLNATELKEEGVKSSPIKKYFFKSPGRMWLQQVGTLPMLNRIMWVTSKRALEVMDKSGVSGVATGKAKAIKIVDEIVNEYTSKFSKTKDFLTAENIIERGMLAFMSRTVIGDKFQVQDEYNRRKTLIEETIEALKDPTTNTEAEIKKGETIKKVYDKILKDSKNISDVKSKVSETNQKAVDWWVSEWIKKYDRLDEVSRNVYNTILSRDANYTPDRFQMKETSPAENEDFESGFFGNFEYVNTSKSGSLRENNRIKNLPKDNNGVRKRIVNLDFDTNNVNAMTSAMVDVETASSIEKVKGFVSSKDFSKLFASTEDANLYKKRTIGYVNTVKGGGYVDQGEMAKLNKLSNAIASLGTAKALFSVSQIPKQFIPPMLNTLAQTGRFDIAELFRGGMNFINESGYPIATRGIGSQGELKSINRKLEEADRNLAVKGLKGILDLNNDAVGLVLKYPDMWAARSSWISFYISELKKQGIKTSKIDWSTHELNKKAADYAQLMVDSQQNISDTDMQGDLFTSKQPATIFLRRAFFPLMSFTLNQKTRIWADARTFTSKVSSKEDKKEAARSVSGAIVEQVAFAAIRLEILKALWYTAKAIWGDDEEEDEEYEKKMLMRQASSTAQNFMKDFFLPPLPIIDSKASEGINLLLDKSGLSSSIPKNWYGIEDEEARFSFYVPEKISVLDQLGTQGIAAEKLGELYDNIRMSTTGRFSETYRNNEVEKQILEEDKEAAAITSAVLTATTLGFLPSEFASVSNLINKKIKRRAETTEEED